MRRGSGREHNLFSSFEESFELPSIHRYRPSFHPSLREELRNLNVWEPNEERCGILHHFNFLLLNENSTVDPDVVDVVRRAGGTVDILHLNDAADNVIAAWVDGHPKGDRIVLVMGDALVIQNILRGHQKLFENIESYGIPVHPSTILIDVVLNVDANMFRVPSRTILTQILDSTSVPTAKDPLTMQLVLASSHITENSSVEDVGSKNQSPLPESSRPRKTLKRRIHAGTTLHTGLEDSSTILQDIPNVVLDLSQLSVNPNPPQVMRSSNLKRRVGVANNESETVQETSQEPPLKKLKPLYEETDPDRQQLQSGSTVPIGTQTQDTDYRNNISSCQAGSLDRDKQISSLPAEGVSLKRKAVIIESADGNADLLEPKRRATRDIRLNESEGSSKDTLFLKATSSKKRGKKEEDNFDREFNDLKLVKPELQHSRPEDNWNVPANFEDDSIRGNFMVIVDIEVLPRTQKRGSLDSTWDGRPNFKKFKKKTKDRVLQPIHLIPSQTNDYGIGDSYWKNDQAQDNVSNSKRHEGASSSKHFTASSKGAHSPRGEDAPDTTLPQRPNGSAMMDTREGDQSQPLFLDSDSDNEAGGVDPPKSRQAVPSKKTLDMNQPKGARSATRAASGGRRAVYMDDDGSDEEIVFKSTRRQNLRR
ncbi:hypothetical protein AX16_006154 [Volvariella volvacea WC 439]|nr:hypothetical protein AX16_006154 [Volvariella volvacea WC 439]